MEANRVLLANKFARIIALLAKSEKVSYREAMDMFYESRLIDLLDEGTADIHCESDAYLSDQVVIDSVMAKHHDEGLAAQLLAYQETLKRLEEIDDKM